MLDKEEVEEEENIQIVVSPEELAAILEEEPKLKGMVHIVDGVVCIGDEPPTAEEMREKMKDMKVVHVGAKDDTS